MTPMRKSPTCSPAPKERSITDKIMRALKKRPHSFTYKTHGGPYQQAGIPDILHWENGKPYAFEVKRPSEEPTSLQALTLDRMAGAGVTVAVVHSVEETLLLLGLEVLPHALDPAEQAHSSQGHE